MEIENLRGPYDPFRQTDNETDYFKVHLHVRQRTTRKRITTVEGLPSSLVQDLAKKFRKAFSCGAVVVGEEESKVIQMMGDQREKVAKYLVKHEICEKDNIVLHGY